LLGRSIVLTIQVLLIVVFMMSKKKENEKKSKDLKDLKNNPRITEATQRDWDDFFAVQEENLFDR